MNYNEKKETEKQRQHRLMNETEEEEQIRWILEDLWLSLTKKDAIYTQLIELVKRYGKCPKQDKQIIHYLKNLCKE